MTAQDVQRLADRAAIHDLHARYFQGLDRSSPEQVRSCFAPDVVARYDGRSPLRPNGAPINGIDELMNSIITFGRQQSGEWKITTHFMGNLNFLRLEEAEAETEVNAIAFIVLAASPGDQLVMRSLRYLDRLRKIDGAWLIGERRHTLDWSGQVPADFAVPISQRVTGTKHEGRSHE